MATEITQIDIQDFISQTYEGADISLLSQFEIDNTLTPNSYIEYFIYDNNKNILSTDYSFTEYTILNDGQSAGNDNNLSQIEINPEQSLINSGYDQGEYITYFNILNKQIGSELQQLYIAEISSDRTEIRLDSTSLTNIDIVEQVNNFIQERDNNSYFLDFYINFGDNQLYIANNISLDNQDSTNPTILIKLYESLSDEFDINSTLWVVTFVEEPIAYKVTFENIPIIFTDTTSISGPNFNLELKDQINNSSLELSYADIIQTSLNSSTQQINSLLEEKEIDINVDYTNFNNFIHFSSIKTRTENFYHKISLIEQYSSSIALINSQITGSTSSSISVSSSKATYESNINNIITNFDGYDYYLYYYSGSSAWPKTNSSPPYQLASTNSNAVLTWLGSDDETNAYYGGILLSASIHDNLNPNNLFYTIPEYLREDPANDPYQLFIEMVGQHYDNIWIYYKDVTQKYNADNRLENGISKDIVADAIRDFGIKLYQNNFSNEDLYTAFLGLTPEGGLFPFPNITGSLPTPSGYEYVNTKISASNDYLPLDDVNKSLYKRIYHNLPYLLQTKGTLPGLRALITSYGIPDTILRIKEYGGKDKINTNDWDYWQNEFNYAYKQNGDNFISSSFVLNSLWGATSDNPETVMFRFKTNGLPTSSIPYSQSLFTLQNAGNNQVSHITLRYTGSAYSTVFPPSSSYNGSIIDPYYQYAYLDFYPDYQSSPTLSASIYLPFFNGEWWSVMAKKTPTSPIPTFELYSGNKMYEGGENGTSIGFFSSSSLITSAINYNNSIKAFFGSGSVTISFNVNAGIYNKFSGSFQEIRYYGKPISESVFRDFVMNPSSIEGNSINSGADQLAFRLSLGGELHTGSNSIHPKVTGSWVTTSSFASDSTAYINSSPTFVKNTEYFYYDQPVVGIKNAIADKIRVENNVIPGGDVLSPFMSLSQQANISQSYTANTNLLEVAFSPQDEVNDDINSSLGFFNIGEYIGDPRLRSSSAEFYPDLNALRDSYFQKYTKNYNLVDFVRLIKFFDNSLFKMIKDFVPARTSLASGIVIKQHILERNKYPQPQVDTNSIIAKYAKSGSIIWNEPIITKDLTISGTIAPQWNDYNAGTVENPNGGTAGVFEIFNGVNSSPYGPSGTGPENIFNLTQSWYETIPTPSGSISILHDAQDEFYDGEFEGSTLTITTQSLNAPFLNENIDFLYTPIIYAPNLYSGNTLNPVVINDDGTMNQFTQDQFLNPLTVPAQGEILLLDNPRNKITYEPSPFAYVKIHKIDHNTTNNSIALGQATRLRIKFTILNNYRLIGDIVETTGYPTYYLYKVQKLDFIYFDEANNYILDYRVSCSVTPSYSVGNGTPKTIINWNSSLPGTNLPHYGTPYFNTSSGIFTFENTSNIKLTLTASINTTGNGITSNFIQLIQIRNQTETVLSTSIYNSGGTNVLTTITSSLYPLLGDQYYIQLTKAALGVGITVNSAQLLLTQSNNWSISTSPTASVSCSLLIEPYITEPNFYNSDNNALLNSVNEQRESTFALDADYGYGTTPINFGLLITGSATPATVPDSNYTSKKSTLLKYEGSKSTSQLLNTWSPPGTIEGGYEDTGTYGKLPTVESLKTYIAYCDNDNFGGLSGWPPEYENASAMFVKYLIKADGTVVIPNTSKDSLSIMQQTFLTGERVIVSAPGGTPLNPYRTVIRGGSHIEPILYTQYDGLPGVNFNTTMSFEDIVLAPGGATANYAALYLDPTSISITPNTTTTIPFTDVLYGAAIGTLNSYDITSACVQDGVDLTFVLTSGVVLQYGSGNLGGWGTGPSNIIITFNLYKNSITPNNQLSQADFGPFSLSQVTSTIMDATNPNGGTDLVLTQTISSANLNASDQIFATIRITHNVQSTQYVNYYHSLVGSTLQVSQYPVYTQPVTSSGYNKIWGYGNKTTYPYIITSSNTTLVQLYGNPNVKAKSITGSGFNSIQLPWKINYGDEFKFEGREDWSYMVKNIYAPAESGNGRIFQTGSIEVHFSANLPVSASPSIFNLDHFLIRRYVDDAGQNVITGFKPAGSTGPYLIKPEFVVPELNKSIDEILLDLTQKGLIT
jgi:hypothetical protein